MKITKQTGLRRSGITTECIQKIIKLSKGKKKHNGYIIQPSKAFIRAFITQIRDTVKDIPITIYNFDGIEINGCIWRFISADGINKSNYRGLHSSTYDTIIVENCFYYRCNFLDETIDILKRISDIQNVYVYGTSDNLTTQGQ